MTLMARYELSTFQHLKGIEQRRSGAAQWLPGPRSIGQKEFPFRTIKLLLLLLFSSHLGKHTFDLQVLNTICGLLNFKIMR